MSVKKIILIALLFLITFVVSVVVLFPAANALQLANKYIPRDVQLGPATGTIWNGQINGLRVQGIFFSKAQWRIEPLALLTGKLSAHVNIGDKRTASETHAQGKVQFNLLNQGLSAESVSARINIAQAMENIQFPLPTQARGRIFVDVEQYTFGQPHCAQLVGEASSSDITVKGTQGWFDIGELESELSCKNGALNMKVEKENRLGLQIDASFNQQGQLTASGFVKPDASLPQDVHQAVQFLGNPTNDGRYRINF